MKKFLLPLASTLILIASICITNWGTTYNAAYVREALDTSICGCSSDDMTVPEDTAILDYRVITKNDAGKIVTEEQVDPFGPTFDGGYDGGARLDEECLDKRATSAAWRDFLG